MSEFLHTGWHEFILPATSIDRVTEYLRVWIDMDVLLPMLRRLDQIYGDSEHPYALDPRQIPDAQRTLLVMVAEQLLAHPGTLRRIATSRAFADELQHRFGVMPAEQTLPYPPFIDQVDLAPSHIEMALPFILDHSILGSADVKGPTGGETP